MAFYNLEVEACWNAFKQKPVLYSMLLVTTGASFYYGVKGISLFSSAVLTVDKLQSIAMIVFSACMCTASLVGMCVSHLADPNG